MSKIKLFIMKYVIPASKKAMIEYLEKSGYCVCEQPCKCSKK